PAPRQPVAAPGRREGIFRRCGISPRGGRHRDRPAGTDSLGGCRDAVGRGQRSPGGPYRPPATETGRQDPLMAKTRRLLTILRVATRYRLDTYLKDGV